MRLRVFSNNCFACKPEGNVSEKILVFIAPIFCDLVQKIYCGFVKVDLEGARVDQDDIKFVLCMEKKYFFLVYYTDN